MQITKITDNTYPQAVTLQRREVSQDDLQSEFDYYRAEKILQKMLKKGLISEVEFHKITALNRESFSPLLAQIMPEKP